MTSMVNKWLRGPDGQILTNEHDELILNELWCNSCGDTHVAPVVMVRKSGHRLVGRVYCPRHGLQLPLEVLPPAPDEFELVGECLRRRE